MWFWAPFHVPVGLLHIVFGNMSICVLCWILIGWGWWLWFAMELYDSFYSLDINPLSVYDCKHFFSFILLIVALCRSLLVWYSPLFIFDFVTFALGVVSKNPCQDPCQGAFFCFLLGILCDENGILLLWSCSLKSITSVMRKKKYQIGSSGYWLFILLETLNT